MNALNGLVRTIFIAIQNGGYRPAAKLLTVVTGPQQVKELTSEGKFIRS